MRIAFVGKGGTGKSTVSTLFAEKFSEHKKTWLIDADLNTHLSTILDVNIPATHHLSVSNNAQKIREYLKHNNPHITSINDFKKTTPPTTESKLLTNNNPGPLTNFLHSITPTLKLGVLGTYEEHEIASSCYHNKLAVLENILSHSTTNTNIICDMVAGTDSFASSLHAQFEALFIIVEPTLPSIQVFKDFYELARKADVARRVFAVGNKAVDSADTSFLQEHIPRGKLVSIIPLDQHIRHTQRTQEPLDVSKTSEETQEAITKIVETAKENPTSPKERLQGILAAHKAYASQGYIQRRHGDITSQIDADFSYEHI